MTHCRIRPFYAATVTHTVGDTIATLYKLARIRCRRNSQVKEDVWPKVHRRQAPASARFGEAPLAQTVAAADAIRRLGSLLLSLEHPHPTVDSHARAVRRLGTRTGARGADRSGASNRRRADDARRIYLDHATDIGAFNPCFPEYRFDHIDAEQAAGRVTFPLIYEGPPGLVHGGFLGVFFDCVMQHQNCVTGLVRQDPVT